MTDTGVTTRHSWLANRNIWVVSDLVLAAVLLIVAAITVWDAGELPFVHWHELNSKFFPSLIAGLLIASAAVLIVRGIFFPAGQIANWSVAGIAVIAIALAVLIFAPATVLSNLMLNFGPAEFSALVVCILAVAIAFSRRSHIRAAGMVFLGLLLATVGMDVITGELRLTFGFEELLGGFDLLIVAPGIIVVADSLVCLFSPTLLLESYGWLVARWRAPTVGAVWAAIMRVAAAIALVAAGYLAYAVNNSWWDVGVVLFFGVFGIASKLLGWNRLVLILAFIYSPLVEQSIRQSMLISRGDPAIFFRWPISAILLSLACAALAIAAALSVRRMLASRAS